MQKTSNVVSFKVKSYFDTIVLKYLLRAQKEPLDTKSSKKQTTSKKFFFWKQKTFKRSSKDGKRWTKHKPLVVQYFWSTFSFCSQICNAGFWNQVINIYVLGIT